MIEILTNPQKIVKKGKFVTMPRAEYERMLEISRRLLLQEKDTDEAIRIFEKEQKTKKLKKAHDFSEILHARKSRK